MPVNQMLEGLVCECGHLNSPSRHCGLGRRRDLVGHVEWRLPVEKKREGWGIRGSCIGTGIRCTESGTIGSRRTHQLGRDGLVDRLGGGLVNRLVGVVNRLVGVVRDNCILGQGILDSSILALRPPQRMAEQR